MPMQMHNQIQFLVTLWLTEVTAKKTDDKPSLLGENILRYYRLLRAFLKTIPHSNGGKLSACK